MNCWKQGCVEECMYFCQCSEAGIYSCETHYNCHLQLNIQHKHTVQLLIFEPKQDTKQVLCSYLRRRNEELNIFQSKFISKIYQKIKKLNTQLKTAIDEISRVKNANLALIERIMQTERVHQNDVFEKFFILEPDIAIKSIQDNIFRIDIQKIPKYIECEFDIFDYSIKGNEINIFRKNSKMLLRVSLVDLTLKETEIAIDQNTNTSLSICKIPNGNLICIGGYPYASTVFMIYPDNSIKYLASLLEPITWASAIYYKNEVYAFGGRNNSGFVITPEKYNISENKWNQLPRISTGANYCNGFGYKNKIFFVGHQHSNVYIYDIQQNSYSEIPIGLDSQNGKALILMRNIFYVIVSSSNIYEIDLNNTNHWKVIGSCEGLGNFPVSHFVEFSTFIYCFNQESNIFKFDLNSKSVQKIQKI